MNIDRWTGTHVVLIVAIDRCSFHRDPDATLMRDVDRALVPRVGVTHHAGPRVVRQHQLETTRALLRPVGHNDNTGVDRLPDPDADAVVDAHPRRAARRV